MRDKKVPDIIITTTIGGVVKYVYDAPINAKRIRVPILVEDPAKAKRFWMDEGARQYLLHFPDNGKGFRTETFAPAAIKNIL
ncbi:MAG TPA: hypothetical protein VF610_11110 [Segetibacter sp.]|jgi:hypothetical protein